MRKIVTIVVAAVLVAAFASLAAAEVVVIVNKGNSNSVDKALVAKIYTGSTSSWPDGGGVTAVDQKEDDATRATFSSKAVGKSVSNLKALWAQNVFTGKGVPPKVVGSDEDVVAIVSKNKNAIGYVDASTATDSVKVVLRLK